MIYYSNILSQGNISTALGNLSVSITAKVLDFRSSSIDSNLQERQTK